MNVRNCFTLSLIAAGLLWNAASMPALAQQPAAEAPATPAATPATPAPKLTELELTKLRLAFRESENKYLQGALKVQGLRAKIGEDNLKQLQDAMSALEPLQKDAQQKYAPLQASCRTPGEAFDPETLTCKSGTPPPAIAAKPAAPGK
jgi:hypothetical protein